MEAKREIDVIQNNISDMVNNCFSFEMKQLYNIFRSTYGLWMIHIVQYV